MRVVKREAIDTVRAAKEIAQIIPARADANANNFEAELAELADSS